MNIKCFIKVFLHGGNKVVKKLRKNSLPVVLKVFFICKVTLPLVQRNISQFIGCFSNWRGDRISSFKTRTQECSKIGHFWCFNWVRYEYLIFNYILINLFGEVVESLIRRIYKFGKTLHVDVTNDDELLSDWEVCC